MPNLAANISMMFYEAPFMDRVAAANADGRKISGQVLTRPPGLMMGFEISQNPFLGRPRYNEIAHLQQAG